MAILALNSGERVFLFRSIASLQNLLSIMEKACIFVVQSLSSQLGPAPGGRPAELQFYGRHETLYQGGCGVRQVRMAFSEAPRSESGRLQVSCQ